MMRRTMLAAAVCSLLALPAACSGDDPTASAGRGTAKFTTWGEEYIEEGIGPDPAGAEGFTDGWSLKYAKFLVAFHAVTVADSTGTIGASMSGSRLVDNVRPGRKELVTFANLDARAWDKISYQIRPAAADTELVGGADPADLQMMVKNGYSIYVEGSATKSDGKGPAITKTFRWGFTTATQYLDCHAEEQGKDTAGIVVANGSTDTSELTTHGDHFFYDRLQEDPSSQVPTRLRFQEKADADANNDGEITLEELEAADIDATRYNPTPFAVTSLGGFVEALARTIGHYRGEGECSISKL
jgi:hypothetical protein